MLQTYYDWTMLFDKDWKGFSLWKDIKNKWESSVKKLKRVKQAGFWIEKVEDITILESDSLETTDRGERGFGSTGRWENVIAYEDYLENISCNIRKLCAEKKVTLSLWYLLLYWEAKMVLSLERLQL